MIPLPEIRVAFARSGGHGGQNVNKIESKAVLHWRVGASAVFSAEQKARIRAVLHNRLNSADEIVVQCDTERSQAQNKSLAIRRLNTLVRKAAAIPKKRRPTKPTRASRERRLESKKRTSLAKQRRKTGLKVFFGD